MYIYSCSLASYISMSSSSSARKHENLPCHREEEGGEEEGGRAWYFVFINVMDVEGRKVVLKGLPS